MPDNQDNLSIRYAGFGIRFLAFIIDIILLGIGLLAVRFVLFLLSMFGLDFLSSNILFHYSISDIILYLCKVLYFVLFTYYLKSTPGKRICKLQLISSLNEPITFFDILYRETIGRYLSGILLGIGYLLIFVNSDRQALHDMLSDTKVVYRD